MNSRWHNNWHKWTKLKETEEGTKNKEQVLAFNTNICSALNSVTNQYKATEKQKHNLDVA